MARGKGWLDWLLSEERRRARRRSALPLVAYYYWDGGNPVAYQVRDASATGFYLVTEHRWYPGTVITMTLQRTAADANDPSRAISVHARVVRSGSDGVGLQFVLLGKDDRRGLALLAANQTDKTGLSGFLERLAEDKGKIGEGT